MKKPSSLVDLSHNTSCLFGTSWFFRSSHCLGAEFLSVRVKGPSLLRGSFLSTLSLICPVKRVLRYTFYRFAHTFTPQYVFSSCSFKTLDYLFPRQSGKA